MVWQIEVFSTVISVKKRIFFQNKHCSFHALPKKRYAQKSVLVKQGQR
jgi:hypothetical protein